MLRKKDNARTGFPFREIAGVKTATFPKGFCGTTRLCVSCLIRGTYNVSEGQAGTVGPDSRILVGDLVFPLTS